MKLLIQLMKLSFNNSMNLDSQNNVVLILNLKNVEKKRVKLTSINIEYWNIEYNKLNFLMI